jgi:chaperone required for assembly of F1-ATPase
MNVTRDDPGAETTRAEKAPVDPVAMARRDLKKALPRRFWTDVAVVARDMGYGIDLDGKPLRTPHKALLVVPNLELAEAAAIEWRAQIDVVEPTSMPLTRLLNTAVDGVAGAMAANVAEVARFAETDLVCYRAGDPASLVAAQAAAWDPVIAFARRELGARFILAEGVMYVEQPLGTQEAVRTAVERVALGQNGALRLAALSLMTNLTGSVLLALAVAHRAMTVDEAWNAAHVDEDYQMTVWGSDAEALSRRAARWRDMQAAATACRLAD